MTDAVQHVLDAFDGLSPAERQHAAMEILRRAAAESSDLGSETLTELADELFQSLDREEEDLAAP